jgi:hypothetical protein
VKTEQIGFTLERQWLDQALKRLELWAQKKEADEKAHPQDKEVARKMLALIPKYRAELKRQRPSWALAQFVCAAASIVPDPSVRRAFGNRGRVASAKKIAPRDQRILELVAEKQEQRKRWAQKKKQWDGIALGARDEPDDSVAAICKDLAEDPQYFGGKLSAEAIEQRYYRAKKRQQEKA